MLRAVVDVIYSITEAIGITFDEGPKGWFRPYVQSERRDIYLQYALELVEKKQHCFSR